MMLDQRTQAKLQIFDQASGPEPLVVIGHPFDDSDLAGRPGPASILLSAAVTG